MAGAKRGGGGGRDKGKREGKGPLPLSPIPSPFSLPAYPLPPTRFDACYAGYRRTGFSGHEPWILSRFHAELFFPTGVFSGRFFLASVLTVFCVNCRSALF